MRSSFPAFYYPTPKQFEELWANALFSVDANVLLNLYRYPKGASADLLDALGKVNSRLWLPHQAALEYQINRLNVIAEQIGKYDEVRKILRAVPNELKIKLDKLQLRRRHSTIDPDSLVETISATIAKFNDQLDELEKSQIRITGGDYLRDAIEELFAQRIGTGPSDQKELDAIYKSGADRYKRRFPPGYEDDVKEKEGFHFVAGLAFERRFGDLILWEELMKEAQSRNAKYLIFITDDNKEDWWTTDESKGTRIISPRRELVEEMRARAGVDYYFQYSSGDFLKYAPEYLGTAVNPDSVEQVREVTKRSEAVRLRQRGSHAVDTVFDWISQLRPKDVVEMSAGYPDILVMDQHGRPSGFEVQYIWDVAEARRRTAPDFYGLLASRPQTHAMSITVVFVASDLSLAAYLTDLLRTGSPMNYIVGLLLDTAEGPKLSAFSDGPKATFR
ncbi:MAG: hypothetical protein JWN34_3717 [Bryobacterales bacterium]|nr:hypothetical protein [Bryobacterales bacterium]